MNYENLIDKNIKKKAIKNLPSDWRLIEESERRPLRKLSTYEIAYPKILQRIRRYDYENGWQEESHYRYLFDDQIYAVPKNGPVV